MKAFLIMLNRKTKENDLSLIISFITLGALGVIMVYSASMVPASKGALTGGNFVESNYFIKKQFVFFIIGTIIILSSFFININILKQVNVQKVIVLGTLTLLLLTIFIGDEVNGSKNWINLGFFSLQSSEFLKLSSIFYLSYIIDQWLSSKRDYHLKNLVPPLTILGCGLLFVLLQGDLGGTILTVAIISCILIYSDIKNKIKLQVLGITLIPISFYLLYTLIFDEKTFID